MNKFRLLSSPHGLKVFSSLSRTPEQNEKKSPENTLLNKEQGNKALTLLDLWHRYRRLTRVLLGSTLHTKHGKSLKFVTSES